jgi:osmotically-inducible protein OsmY
MKNKVLQIVCVVVFGAVFALAQTQSQQSSQSQQAQASQQQTQESQQTGATGQSSSVPQSSATSNAASNATSNTTTSGSNTAAASTDGVQARINQALLNEPSLTGANVSAKVTDSSVELTGTVPDKASRKTAVRIAKENAGNRKVIDHTTIGEPSL